VAVLTAIVATVMLSSLDRELPPRITPIADLDALEQFRHTEVLQVERDFGQPNVNVALDAWTPVHDAGRIDGVRVWWSDEVDRYPFNARVRKQLAIDYRRVRADRWRIRVGGARKHFVFEVALHEGRPAVFADVTVAGGGVVRRCRADSAQLYALRVLGIPVGLREMVVTCTAPDGTVHRGTVRVSTARARRVGR
jgi:hypothetical protein